MITTRAVPALLPGHHRPVAQLPVTAQMTLPTPSSTPNPVAAESSLRHFHDGPVLGGFVGDSRTVLDWPGWSEAAAARRPPAR
jgi:hypothetical protein